jgi:hypothetical protein
MTGSRIDRCPLCGGWEPIEREHIIRRANSPDETWPIGASCHHRHITQRQDEIGVTPGLDPCIARPGGYGIYLVCMLERHGMPELADRYRVAENYWSRTYGKPKYPRRKPRRAATVTVADPDDQIMMQDMCELLADMFRRQSADDRLPEHAQETLRLFAAYANAARLNPGSYAIYQAQRGDTLTLALSLIDELLSRMAEFDIPVGEYGEQLAELLRREAKGFLRFLDLTRWEREHSRTEAIA